MTETDTIEYDGIRIGSNTDAAAPARRHVYFNAKFPSPIGAQRTESDHIITVWKATACERTGPGVVRLRLHATSNNPYRLSLHY